MTDISSDLVKRILDHSFRHSGLGPKDASTQAAFQGFHFGNGAPLLPVNTDNNGFIFFTRPDMNLTYDNVSVSRRLSALNNPDPYSMGALIRSMLMPPLAMLGIGGIDDRYSRSAIFNDRQAFLPILSNTCLTFSGISDLTHNVYVSNEGINKEQIAMIDDKPYTSGAWNANATFVNMEGDPLTALFMVWWEVMGRVVEGSMAPFPTNLVEGRKDYETRIYRFIMDRSKRYIQNTATTIAFPTMVATGSKFDFDRSNDYNAENTTITQNFQCQGLEIDDPINIWEFNAVVDRFLFNRSRTLQTREIYATDIFAEAYDYSRGRRKTRAYFTKIEGDDTRYFGQYAYPWIEDDMELSWYAETEVYDIVNANRKTLNAIFDRQ